MSTRPTDWPQRLAAFLATKEREPFAWGRNDCCLFTADWVLALTGADPAEGLRGTYDSALSAGRLLSAMGGAEGIADAALSERGWASVPVKLAMRGDVVATDTPDGSALGVCVGETSAFAGKTGTIYKPTLSCVRAWRIG